MSVQAIPLPAIDACFFCFRLTTPVQVTAMRQSLGSCGQLHPVTVRRAGSVYQLVDGFKRYYAARDLQWESLRGQVLEADDMTAKVMIFVYNSHSGSLADYEQACIVSSLRKEHLLGQEDIARLVGKSISWVSRRLSFIERLDDTVQSHLRIGRITCTHARELSGLPRGKQPLFLKAVVGHNLTSRQTGLLVKKYLRAGSAEEQKHIHQAKKMVSLTTVEFLGLISPYSCLF